MKLQNKKTAILIENLYQELEVWYPYYRLKEEGAEVVLIGNDTNREYAGKYGYPAKADSAIKDANASHFDAVIIPGGFAPDYMRRTAAFVNFIKEMHKKGAVVAAICHGPWMLASADILRGKKATCFYAIKDDIANAGALYLDEEVVQDGSLITSRSPDDLPTFCAAIIAALAK